jgi:uncharacterized FlaG/YvyC family protein
MDLSSMNSLAARAATSQALSEPASADRRALIQAVRSVDTAGLFGADKELTFVRDFATQTTVARIIDKETGDVVAQVPPEDILQMAEEVNGS